MAEMLIECQKLSLGYGMNCVLTEVDLKIPKGVLLPFVGPNGAGKTTLFNALLGLHKPSGGSLVRNFGQWPPGYVPQQKTIDPRYPVSVRQLVAMGFYPETGPFRQLGPELLKRLENTLQHFGLLEHQQKTFAELSGGLKQKTLIARAFVGRSEVIFLDEPTAGLDAASEDDLLRLIRDLNRNQQKSILLAHHRLEDLSSLAEQVCLIWQHRAKLCPAAAVRTGTFYGN
ncbi:MAG: ATP-binding cassette domain-containing protein [Lentisphaerae bacterium]|jgi:ABC-type Mn2+/Zn2+ transport system ATPase subunit|nr:ATP-binding cassette domain-containing protein [Lentisphaerota bacterium]